MLRMRRNVALVMLFLFYFVLHRVAFADTIVAPAPSATTVDFQDAAMTLLGLASAAITAAIPILVPFLLKRWNVANNADAAAKVTAAADDAAGMMYNYATKYVGGLSNVDVHSAGLAQALQHMTNEVGPEIKTLGYSADHVSNMVTGSLGALLAVDPTVSAGAPQQSPVPAKQPAPIPVHLVATPPDAPKPA